MKNKELLKPKRLQNGDTIGLVSPASPLNEKEQIYMAVEVLESMGFKVKQGEHLFERRGYLAGSARDRAADLNAAFADEKVDGIITLCGGYGSPQILSYLDYEMIRANPKLLMGYSDITALLNGIYQLSGLVTFHGMIAYQGFSDYSYDEFEKVALQGQKDIFLGAPPVFNGSPGRVERKHRLSSSGSGSVRGRLIGGNLSLMATLCGSKYAPDYSDKIVFFEEVGEATYRIDRMLTQLILSGDLQKASGIVFGKFSGCTTSASWVKQLTLEEVFADCCEKAGKPAIRGLLIGHVEDQTTLPLGCQAELNLDEKTLKLLETAVI